MSYPQKTVIAVNLNSDYKKMLAPIKEMSFLNTSEIHLVYVFPSISYGFVFEGTLSFPVPDEKDKIQEKVNTLLSEIEKNLLPTHKGTVKKVSLFDESPSEAINKYINEQKADLAIVATGLRKGIFESSVATYLSKHSSANLLVIRPH